MTGGEYRADHAAPVVDQQVDRGGKVQVGEEIFQVLDAAFQGEGIAVCAGFAGEAAAHVIRDDDAADVFQLEYGVAIEKGPGGVAVEHDHRRAAAFVEVVILEPVQVQKVALEGIQVLQMGRDGCHGVTTPRRASCNSGRCRCRGSRFCGRVEESRAPGRWRR